MEFSGDDLYLGTMADSLGTVGTNLVTDTGSLLTTVAPVAFVIFGAFLLWRVFKRIARGGSWDGARFGDSRDGGGSDGASRI